MRSDACLIMLSGKEGSETGSISHTDHEIRTSLETELQQYRKQGIALYLDGEPGTPRSIAKACMLCEEGCGYMRDYTSDEAGHIARIDFDFIKNGS